jgi:hypothetical protein
MPLTDIPVKNAKPGQRVFPWLGKRPIHEISPQEMLAVIQRIEDRGAGDTVHRTLGSCSQVYSYGIAKGVCNIVFASTFGVLSE